MRAAISQSLNGHALAIPLPSFALILRITFLGLRECSVVLTLSPVTAVAGQCGTP
jgi:hypothetical protein